MTESEKDFALKAFDKWAPSPFPSGYAFERVWFAAVEWAWQNQPEEEKDGGSGQFGVGA